ncbi:ComEA family DNA-binding protein [Bacteroides caecigallinarum]|uniref:ComEA family DNA-binding protein n=1 Tax=Bacteroides caecigallinarum TaxID=1411144 RepID=UPI001F43F513|nr:helix-hairpin-helix domain-containing protein [Bacteroides caecigallinarum]MCF2581137.1 helix-hairpin-helix domain-containing protein [Bacteroides caecigallinarum]
MWNDWFFYSRGQRRAIILLLLSLILLIAMLASGSFGDRQKGIAAEPLAIADSLYRKVEKDKREYERKYAYRKSDKKERTASTKEMKRSADTSTYAVKEEKRTVYRFPKQEKFQQGIVVDVNTADTLVLKKIPGIGSVISRNIVNYRNRLGGFYDVSQLLEVKYVDTTLLLWFQVKSDVYRKISINKADIDELRSHPYMDFYKARAVVDYRRKRGKITGMSQLSMLKEFSDEDMIRLSHYFSFE